MPLSPFLNTKLLEIIDHLLQYHISVFFDHPVDPERDQVPNYYNVIKNPMDLGTIREKIDSSGYDNVSQFIADVELVWSNAMLFNGKGSFVGEMARHLQNIFKEEANVLHDNEQTWWINKMNDLRNKVNIIITNPPPLISTSLKQAGVKLSSVSSASIPSPSSVINYNDDAADDSFSLSRSKSKSSIKKTSSSSHKPTKKSSSKFSDDDDQDEPIELVRVKSKSFANYSNDSDDYDSISRHKNKSASNKKKVQKQSSYYDSPKTNLKSADPDLTEDEIEKLAQDVNQLAYDADKNSQISDLLQKMEPTISFEDEVGVEKLSMPTLKALRRLVNQLL